MENKLEVLDFAVKILIDGRSIKMNETIRNIKTRRSVKSYKSEMVPSEIIDQIIEAGTYAPSGMNKQSPIIVAITDKETRNKLSKLNAKIAGKEGSDPFYGAPVVLVVLADKNCSTYINDGSLVMGNLLLAAHSLNIGSCWIHRAKEVFETEEGKEILKSLGIGDNYEGIGNCILGYPTGEKLYPSPRKENYVYKI